MFSPNGGKSFPITPERKLLRCFDMDTGILDVAECDYNNNDVKPKLGHFIPIK